MIDPNNITNFNRTDDELEEFMLFCPAVAGKTAKTAANALDDFLNSQVNLKESQLIPDIAMSPFKYVQCLMDYYKDGNKFLYYQIKLSGLGKYWTLYNCYRELVKADLDLRKCTAQDLENIYGIGFKTSRYFLVHSRPAQKLAILDTHILKFMREEMKVDTPKSTPQSAKKYYELEKLFVKEASNQKKSVAQLDLEIWNMYSR